MWYQRSSVEGPSFFLQFLVKKRHNSKYIAFRVMSLVLQLQLVMMSKCSKFGVDTFNASFYANGLHCTTTTAIYLAITIARPFLRNRTKNHRDRDNHRQKGFCLFETLFIHVISRVLNQKSMMTE